jgi:hypothetical protein
MANPFNDTTNYTGIVQMFEEEVGLEEGYISGNTKRLKQFAAWVNSAMDDFMAIALQSSGNWAFDDTNHDDYPIISTDIVSGQRDYSVLEDQDGNPILDIYKVVISDAQGNGRELEPIEVTANDHRHAHWDISAFYNGTTTSGVPNKYAKTGNGIFLDPVPNYNRTGGLLLYVNRAASRFTYTDTTKKPGVPALFQKYLWLKPALDYARRNNLSSYPRIEAEVIKLEGMPSRGIQGAIQRYFGRRERDIRKGMRSAYSDNK